MGRFSFEAINEKGLVVRGVMEAADEAEAREILLGENVFGKRFEVAPEDAKITWVPRQRILKQRQQSATSDQSPVEFVYTTECLYGLPGKPKGQLGLSKDGALCFVGSAEKLQLGADEIEVADLRGFPRRELSITTLAGKTYLFAAGIITAKAEAKQIAKKLKK